MRVTVERERQAHRNDCDAGARRALGRGLRRAGRRAAIFSWATSRPVCPREKAGLKKGDLIRTANGQPIHSVIKFHEIIRSSGGKPVVIELLRNGEKREIAVQPVFSKLDGPERWVIGAYVEQKYHVETSQPAAAPGASRNRCGRT